MAVGVSDLESLLAGSSASDAFKEAVQGFERGRQSPLITFSPSSPRVKVMRVIMKLLESEPELPIESVHVDGRSGCSDFRGTAIVNRDITFHFHWDCRWRALQEGWKDAWGYPDQIKAAQQYGYQCFEEFRRK